MAQNVTVQGASYSDVPALLLPKVGGGSARFDDTSDADATASDILSGKTAYVNGVKLTGTGSGGGSVTQDQDGFIILPPDGGGSPSVSGLEFETGTWTPSEDVAKGTITLQNQHDSAPCFYAVGDMSPAATLTQNSNTFCGFFHTEAMFGAGVPYNSTGNYFRYAHGIANYLGSNSATTNYGFNCGLHGVDDDGSTMNMPSFWASSTELHPYSGSASRYWRAGRTYKWIAVWKPTT